MLMKTFVRSAYVWALAAMVMSVASAPCRAQWQRLGLSDRWVSAVEIEGDFLYAATDNGLYRLPLAASEPTWEFLGLLGEDIKAVIPFNSDTILAGLDSGDTVIYRTTNGGSAWHGYENGYGGSIWHPVKAFERVPGQADTFYAVGYGVVARTTNAGQSWQDVLHNWEQPGMTMHFVKVDDSRHNIVWAGGEGMIFNPLLYKSTDAGDNWEALSVFYAGDNRCHDIAAHPTEADLAYVSMEGQIQKTTNGGIHWDLIHTNIFYLYGIELDPLRPFIFYVSGAQSGQPLTITRTADGGASFTEIVEPTEPETWAFNLLLVSETDRNTLYFPTNIGVFRYTEEFAYLCGDIDGNQIVNVSDVVYLIAYIFAGGPPPTPLELGDVDCSGLVNVSDAVYLITFIFGGGPDPCDPDGDEMPDC